MSEKWEVMARQVFATKAEAENAIILLGWEDANWKTEIRLLLWVLEIPDAPPCPSLDEIAEVL